MRFHINAVLLLLVLPVLASAQERAPIRAVPEQGPARTPVAALLASTPGEVRVRVPFEAPRMVQEGLDGTIYSHLAWDGVPPEGEPGEPALPTHRIRIAVPPTGDLRLEVQVEPRGSAGGMRFPPVPSAVEDPEPPARREEHRPRTAHAEGDRYRVAEPTPHAEIVHVGVERGVRIATVAIRPASWNPVTSSASWIRSATVTLRTGGRHVVPATPPRPDRGGEAMWEHTLANPRDALRYRASVADSLTAAVPSVWFEDAIDGGRGWLKIRIARNGMYRLGRSELSAAGVPVDTLDPREFRLYSGPLIPEVGWAALGWDSLACASAKVLSKLVHVYDRPEFSDGFTAPGPVGDEVFGQVAIWVPGEEDGVFDGPDQVVFYALGPDNFRDRFGLALDTPEDYLINPYTDETVYWLTWGESSPESLPDPLRMDEFDATPQGSPVQEASTARIHAEENNFPDRSLYQGGLRWEGWFWDLLFDTDGVKRYFVDLPHLIPGTTMSMKTRFWGAKIPTRTDVGEATRHHVRVIVNGASLGLAAWGSSQPAAAFSAYDMAETGIAAANPSEFRYQVLEVTSVDPNRLDEVHLAWIDVSYRRYHELDGRAGELEVDAGPSGRQIQFRSLPTGSPLLFDVTDFRRPRRMTGVSISGSGANFSLDRPERRVVAVATTGTLLGPRSLELDTPPSSAPGVGDVQWLRNPAEPLDYVIIAADELVDEAEELAAWRRDHLYPFTPDRPGRVRVVRVSDVMDEFAWGMWDPIALRYFLEYAYCFYGGPGDDPLTYAVFFGDSTNDPRDYARTGVRDRVPSWEDTRDEISRIATWGSAQYVSDDPLARFDSPDALGCPDALTDLVIGRISPRTPSLAQEIVRNKIIRAEENPDYGPWRTKTILVADDRCSGTGPDGLGSAHMTQMEDVSKLIPPLFFQDKIYLYEYGNACIYNSKPAAKQALISSWSDGAWMVNYIGHGADVVWADEHVLDLADTPLLTNDGRYPVVGSFSCSVGKFSNPSRDGLGEAHFLSPRGGSLVSAAASHLTSSFSNHLFNLEFMRQLFTNGPYDPPPIGVALMNTKRIRNDGESLKYVCLGDPASRLSVPPSPLEIGGPATLDRGELVDLSVRVPGDLGRGGTVETVARDALLVRDTDENGNPIFFSYELPGALLFRGRSSVVADSAASRFTVPVSLRGGDSGSIRAYAWGGDWDAAGALAPMDVGGIASASADSLGPAILFSITSGSVAPGEKLTVTLEDPSGINLTQLFEFRSILLKVLDRNDLEQFRQDLTPLFAYESGQHTRGALEFTIPDLEPAPYTFTLSATDNYNNRSVGSVDLEVGSLAGAVEFEDVPGAYPNPFNPEVEPTRVVFSLSRSAPVTVRIYSVSGRLVRKGELQGTPGSNAFTWDGRDESRDPVANGVYLVQLTTRGEGDQDTRKHLERVVVLRR